MADTRIQINSIVGNQLPSFVKEEFPLVEEFLSQYYLSIEGQGLTLDILQNIDQYIKVDNLTNLTEFTNLTSDVDFTDDIISVESTYGFPKSYGLIQIDSEIITYTGITTSSFTGCVRGFSGITSYKGLNKSDELVFSQSGISTHSSGSIVNNLSVLFLKEFFNKVKKQVTPGFEDRELYSEINQGTFIKQAKDFYSSKGSDQSFEILFRALYGEDISIIRPSDFLLIPSDAQYRITKNLVVEPIEGNPEDLLNKTIFQDQTNVFSAASGSVSRVQKIVRNGKNYYVLSLDYDFDKDINVDGSVFGNFNVHPKTTLITSVSIGSTVLDVDSTVGFPATGTLIAKISDDVSVTINYGSKTLNQFFDCDGIDQPLTSKQELRLDSYAYGYSGITTESQIKFRVTGVLSDLDFPPEKTYYYDTGDIIQIKSLGIGLTDYSANNWIFNIPVKYKVKNITLQNNIDFLYSITTFDIYNFNIGDTAKIISSDGTERNCVVVEIVNKYEFVIRGQGQIDTQQSYEIQKTVSKVNSNNYPELNIYSTNVQNVYSDKESLYVASPSIPNYLDQPLNINDRSVILNGIFNGEDLIILNHGFYTGDSVIYKSVSSTNTLNIPDGIYFVKKVDENTIKLSKSRSNIFKENYVSVNGTVTDNILSYTKFFNKKLEPQKIIRKISTPVTKEEKVETTPGLIGILVNGVEILNYKSDDSVFYGAIQNIDVTSEGSGYDLINPPVLEISDSIGSGVSCYCEVEGNLERIDVLDGGFDYVKDPIITISGGNGTGTIVNPNLIFVDHTVTFNAEVVANLVDLVDNKVAFSTYHKFRDGELVVYNPNGQTIVGGLSTNSSYYVSVEDSLSVKFHVTYSDALSRLNPINLTSYGTGNHTIESVNKKKKIGSITISNSGSGYKNRKTTVSSSGINTASNTITIQNHKYETGEIILYTPGTQAISGLSSGSYYVTKIDVNNFKLSQIGIGSTSQDYFFKNKEYVNLLSTGLGRQTFNYPPVEVKISGVIGVSTFTGQNFQASLQPVFRGQIKSVFIEDGGVGYGASEILNYNRQPSFNLNSGSGAQLQAIVQNGKISSVLVLNSGSGYNSVPNIIISGSGSGASLITKVSNGSIESVEVVNGGEGYLDYNTTITAISAGSGGQFLSIPKKWTVNIFERLVHNQQIVDDDGIITIGTNSSFGLQYSHLYSPKKLRQSLFATKIINGNTTFVYPDLQLQNGKEFLSDAHSPVIGWAYDGNPIYGPYGYEKITGGSIKLLQPGYSLLPSQDRPNPVLESGESSYPSGFFVEDYSYQNIGDLDEHNGRFCVTPEFPKGIYAYFTTIDPDTIETLPPFKNYRKPVFPYFVGNTFNSQPIDYNFDRYSNQDDIDLSKTNLIRNATPYNFNQKNSSYDFVIDPNKIQKQNTEITNVAYGSIQSIGIVTGGFNYQVNDSILFDNTNTDGFGAKAKVFSVLGKQIQQISIASSSILNVEFVPYTLNSRFVGYSTLPHNLNNGDRISISGLTTTSSKLQSFFTIGVSTSVYSLSENVLTSSITGIVTYFNVYGNLSPQFIRENDILTIENEKIKVLNIDPSSSRIRVLREYDGTVGSSHTASTAILENSRKFIINSSIFDRSFNYNYTKEFYFNPKETLALGNTSGVGIGSTIVFSNPGVGLTQIFIPTKSAYFPNHNLSTGDELIYSTNGGGPVSISTDGVSVYQLINNQIVYAAKISNDLIGIATSKVGLGSTGTFVGINSAVSVNTLYFIGVGTGNNHSFKTNPTNILKGNVSKNVVTVSTATTHGLNKNDTILLESKPGITTTVVIQYNDFNRRLIVNPRSFISTNVDISTNTITIENHNFQTGEKVIHTSSSPSGGLINNEIYYVYVKDKNNFNLCSTQLNSTKLNPVVVDISSASSGTISKINPLIKVEKNKTIVFDLSHSSLAFISNSISYSAFDFDIYSDSELKNAFYTSSTTNNFEVSKQGVIGIDANAKLILNVTDDLPKVLYYNLTPINLNENSEIKKQIIIDKESVNDNNTITITDNSLSGYQSLTGIGSTTFTFDILNSPVETTYTNLDGKFRYSTNSTSAYGSIFETQIVSSGRNYKKLPPVSSVVSTYGTGSILDSQSNTIGNILNVEIQDIGFDYPSDITLRPEAQFPQILKVEPFSSINRIGITSIGTNYIFAPDLVLLDGLTGNVITDIDITYELGDSEVTILKNTKGLNNKIPTIIPINNSNGVGISSISFNNSTKNVTVSIAVSYSSSNDFPFSVGDSILIENISVGLGSTGLGYNSSNYNYSLFTLTQIDANIGGNNPTVTYNLSNYLSANDVPGVYDPVNSAGTIIPSKYFPSFDISIVSNQFFENEIIKSPSTSGVSNSWDSKNGYLKVSSPTKFIIDEIIVGESSSSQGIVRDIINFNTQYNVGSFSIVKEGWSTQTGFLNNDLQRMHDNDYYQYFSYSVKSKVSFEKWDDIVSSQNHTAGFKKFSDLILESIDEQSIGIKTSQNFGDFVGISDLVREIDTNCVNDFDLAKERILNIDSKNYSNEIVLNSKIIQDYIESVGNRVLMIDDISNQFNSNPRPTPFSSVDLSELDSFRSKKYITYVIDERYSGERQILLVSLIHNNSFGFLNQYGRVETVSDLGSFDFNIFGVQGQLLFYPTKYEVNDYVINLVSYDIRDTIVGIGTLDLGDVVKIQSSTQTLPTGTSSATTIVGIASTYRTSKILVQYGAIDNSYFEYDELTVIHNGTEVELLEYGQLTTNNLYSYSSPGLGTYSAYLSGSNVNIDFTPNVGLAVTHNVNTFRVSIANTSSVGVGTTTLNNTILNSRITSIGSSTSPIASTIAEYDNLYSCAYYIVSIEDTTNNQYQISEVVIVDDGITPSLTEFGILQTGANLGSIGASISSNKTQLTFTPIANINIQVRVFQNALRLTNPDDDNNLIEFTNAEINSGRGFYEGTESDVKRTFNLTHNQLPIFERNFVGSASTIVDITNNLIKIPNHYFVTGEELEYSYPGAGTTQAIGIVTTFIVGIGTTDKLPTTVYPIKVDNTSIRLAATAENALSTTPTPLLLSSVGVGTNHSLVGQNQNSRVIVSIDNIIQSPIVSTSITTTLAANVSISDNTISVSGITSFFGSDLIKINNEIMRIDSVGFGSENVFLVRRFWMGTGISTHSNGDLVTKINGNYNIIDNVINFADAPYGLVPIGTTSASPDDVDYLGISTYSTFSGRSFMRSGVPNATDDPYSKNYIFDDISTKFTGYTTSFNLTSGGSSITGFSTDNSILLINQIFQQPQRLGPLSIEGSYTIKENVGNSSIQFIGSAVSTSYDVNTASIPRGGIIISVASTEGFGYQPLVSAGGTAIVSGLGTISSISIGNSGSGYRSGIQTVVNVGVATSSTGTPNIQFIGTAAISNGRIVSVAITNPGSGYTSTNPPVVIFDNPLSYSNIPLIYSSSSTSGLGSNARVNIVVGQGSSVIDFEIINSGYGYGQNEILTVGIGGTVGIPTDTSIPFREFNVTIDRTYSDSFSGWTVGNLQVIDSLDSLFDDQRVLFPIKIQGVQKTILSKPGSLIDVQASLLVFINDILQVPGEGYSFEGGSFITFTEPPKSGDTSKILFYQGTSSIDVVDVDILETIKVGDEVRLNDDNIIYKEDQRVVLTINSSDSLNTNVYPGPGISIDETYTRPLIWCRQTEDRFINGEVVAKDRELYEPLIYPTSNIIQTVGVGSTVIFVESVKTFFDSVKENSLLRNKITIISQDSIIGASATTIVSVAGTISSISITNGGIGYTFAPTVTIANPVGLGITQRATANSSVTSGIVTSISIVSPGIGYTLSNPPAVLIQNPNPVTEEITSVTYSGDFGIISGISTTSVGVASTGIIFDLLIPSNSFLRDSSIVGSAITVSGIQTGYYFVVYNSNVGNGVTSLRRDGSVVGVGTSFLDNVYEVSTVSIAQTNAVGVGLTYVAKVTVSVRNYNGLTGIGYSNFFGEYSWGRISVPNRIDAKEFNFYNNGLSGISTSAIVKRYAPLKYLNYN